MRKLASIQQISDIQPIEGADAIEVASVNGWKVVVKKGEFKVGDKAVYFEIDSFIPESIAPFLTKNGKPKEYMGVTGNVLKTIKLRGQLSQGLLIPIETLFPTGDSLPIQVGMDVTDILGVKKWEPPIPAQLTGEVKGPFPSKTVKTDEERIQNLSDQWDQLKKLKYEVTEKLDGSSCQFGLIDGEFLVCSRNTNLRETENNSMWKVVRSYDVENKMRALGLDNIMIQTEIIGEGIQGNKYKLKGQDVFVFAIFDCQKGEFVSPNLRKELVQVLGLKHVPVLFDSFALDSMTIHDVLKIADGESKLFKTAREGLVFKQVDGQAHFKAISNEFLLKEK